MKINLLLTNIKNRQNQFKTLKNQNSENRKTQSSAFSKLVLPLNYYTSNLSINFQARCPEDAFAVKDILNLHCPVCGQIMLNKNQIEEIANQLANKTGEKLIRTFEFYEDERNITKDESETEKRSIFRNQKQQIVNILKELARKHPNANLSELVKIEADKCLGELIVAQMDVVRELENYLSTAPLELGELESLNYIIQIYKNQILGKNEERFKRQAFIHDLKNRVQNEEVQAKINEIISKLPNSSNSIDSFFVKWGFNNPSCKEIAHNLVYDARPTAEHLLPKSKGGKNDTLNYLCDCAECNSSRGNTDFKDWAKTIPDFEQKLQEHLETIARTLDGGALDYTYYGYIEGIVKTISDLSQNSINLTLPKVCNSPEIIHAERKRNNALNRAKEAISALEIKISTLKEEIRGLQEYPYYNEITYLRTLLEREEDITKAIESNKEKLGEIESELREIARLKKKITDVELQLEKMRNNQNSPAYAEKQKTLETYRNNVNGRNEQQLYLDKDAVEARIETLEAKLENVQILIARIREVSRERLVSIRLAQLAKIIEASNEAYTKLSQYKDIVSKETRLKEEQEARSKENSALEDQNAQICLHLNTANVNQDNYLKYLHLVELTEEADSIKDQKRNRKNKNLVELMDIAQSSINSQAALLLEDETVTYFLNLDKLTQNKKRIEAIAKELTGVEEAKAKIKTLEEQLKEINGNSTYEQNSQEYADISQEHEAIQKAKNVPQLKQQLEELESTLNYYNGLFSQLTADPKPQDSEFFRIVQIICSKN